MRFNHCRIAIVCVRVIFESVQRSPAVTVIAELRITNGVRPVDGICLQPLWCGIGLYADQMMPSEARYSSSGERGEVNSDGSGEVKVFIPSKEKHWY